MTDDQIHEGLIRLGLIIPVTAEDVRIAEEELAKLPDPELPDSLKDPYEIIRRHPEVFGPLTT